MEEVKLEEKVDPLKLTQEELNSLLEREAFLQHYKKLSILLTNEIIAYMERLKQKRGLDISKYKYDHSSSSFVEIKDGETLMRLKSV